jgi:hypothetical protein
MTRVSKVQTKTTYSVETEERNYTVAIIEDYGSPEVQWGIFDSEDNDVTDPTIIEPIVQIIEAFMSESALRICQCSSSN